MAAALALRKLKCSLFQASHNTVLAFKYRDKKTLTRARKFILSSTTLKALWFILWFCMYQVELSCPKEMAWKVNMHRGYLAICHPEEQQLNFIERLVEMASSLAIREWRRLPHIVSHVHTPLLQVSNITRSG